jgi:HAMP domain-containing protein
MEAQHVFNIGKTLAWRIIPAAMAFLILSGCGGSLLGSGKTESENYIWKHRDQFVRIENQGRGNGPIPPNHHPVQLSADQLRTMLGALDAQFESEEKPVPMFTYKELEILGDALSTGLATAQPHEDVTFAIVGIHREFISFTSDRQYVSGRVFYQDGKLNLIIATLHEPYWANVDRRMSPLETGSRKYTAPDPRKTAPRPWKPVAMAGLETPIVAGINRTDWLVLNPDTQLWKTTAAEKKEAKETAKAAFREASEVRETSAQLETEQQQLRTELEQMKQTIQEMKQAPVKTAPPAAAAPAPAPAPAAAPAPGMSKIEERLDLLKKLKSKGLITEEEYQAKKQEILDSL